ncbi:unnamed protein product [Dicrocoelium dendriticum]|nr:unnamed protein product [Dicrocoelium dendriticum]
MLPQATFYPWSDNFDNKLRILQRMSIYPDNLSGFLDDVCLGRFYDVCKKKLHVSEPIQFARFSSIDLLQLGLTEAEVNRLVCRLLDLGLPIGNLLPTGDDSLHNTDQMWRSQLDLRPSQNANYRHTRSKLLRKLFGKKHDFYSSAPVSPLHRYHQFDKAPLDNSRCSRPRQMSTRHDSHVSPEFSAAKSYEPTVSQTNALPRISRDNDVHRDRDYSLELPMDPTALPTPPLTCLIPERDIKVHSRLGVGSFGIVRRADWTTPSGDVVPVAVKLLRPEAMAGDHFASFLDELRAMQCLSHPNLIRLYGVVLSNPTMLVTELAPLGSLLLHLRAHSICANAERASGRLPSVPTALQVDSLWDMGVQIARGMAYLSARGLVHRDLAARNILLAAVRRNEYPQVKIGDFGLARTITCLPPEQLTPIDEGHDFPRAAYMGKLEQRIPFAWSAPESLRNRMFSQASDVWSWAVTAWELWTNGAAPWPNMNASQLLAALDAGRRLAWPRSLCPRRLYQLMLACWRREPNRRPSFAYLADRLDRIRPFEVTATQTFDEADRLGLEYGDLVVVLDSQPDQFWWRGQNRRTGDLGSFPKSIVRRDLVSDSKQKPSLLPPGMSVASKSPMNRYSPSYSRFGDSSTSTTNAHHQRKWSLSSYSREAASGSAEETNNYACKEQVGLDGTWCPLRDSSIRSSIDRRITQGSEDEYSCSSIDFVSTDGPYLEHYDGEDDERALLDRTPSGSVGTACSTVISYCGSKSKCSSCMVDFNDFASETNDCLVNGSLLPPPPGPPEDETIGTTSPPEHSRLSAHHQRPLSVQEPFDLLQSTPRNSPEPATRARSTSFSNVNCEKTASETANHSTDSMTPLIDLHSPTPRAPFTSPQRFSYLTPSAPVYLPRSSFFPAHRPAAFGTSFPQYAASAFSSCPAPPPLNSFAPSTSTATIDPLDPFELPSETERTLSALLPEPPDDPFDWDRLKRCVSSMDHCNPDSRESTPTLLTSSESVNTARVERELLVGSAAPRTPFHSHETEYAAKFADFTRRQSAPMQNSAFQLSNPKKDNLQTSGSTGAFNTVMDPLAGEIDCVRAQVPGCSIDEASHALTYLLNPFAVLNPCLSIPPLPSAPPYQASLNQASAHEPQHVIIARIQLAVRLVLAHRLCRLGLIDWDRSCQVLSSFHWNLFSAADWLVDQKLIKPFQFT